MAEFKWATAKLDSNWEMPDCIFERKGPIARFTLNNPEKRNAYTQSMWAGMKRACEEVLGDFSIRALVVTGAGDKAFCAGPAGFSKTPGRMSAEGTAMDLAWRDRRPELNFFMKRRQRLVGYLRHKPIWDVHCPVICRLNGLAVGAGADWVMAADIIVAAEHAFLGWWYAKRGLSTDMGGCWYLTQVVGPYRAKEIILSARSVYAPELKELGIASRVAPYAKLDDEVDKLCSELIDNAPVAIAADKELIDKAVAMQRWPWFDQSTEMILGVIDTDDCAENRLTELRGVKPVWKGR